ncbi:phage protein [Acinetobacter baumannii]
MSEQWKRNCRLTVQLKYGEPEALDLSEMRIVFRINQPTAETPKAAEFYIYNLSEDTMNRLAGEDNSNVGAMVTFEVGYGDELSTIFKGSTFQYRREHESPTDKFLCILAQSGDKAKNYALVNKTIAAGTTVDQVKNEIAKEYQANGVETGELPQLSDQTYVRGKVMFGSLDDQIRQFCKDTNTEYFIDDEYLYMVGISSYLLDSVFEMNANTGMVGMPQLTTEGLMVNCLLNPQLRRGRRIHVDTSSIQTQAFDIDYQSQGVDQPQKDLKTAGGINGIYIIKAVEHYGDTRGDDWYTSTVSVGQGAVVPKSGITITAVD